MSRNLRRLIAMLSVLSVFVVSTSSPSAAANPARNPRPLIRLMAGAVGGEG